MAPSLTPSATLAHLIQEMNKFHRINNLSPAVLSPVKVVPFLMLNLKILMVPTVEIY